MPSWPILSHWGETYLFSWVFELILQLNSFLTNPIGAAELHTHTPTPPLEALWLLRWLVPVFLTALPGFLHRTSFLVQFILTSPGLCSQSAPFTVYTFTLI